MNRAWLLAVCAGLGGATIAPAQAPAWRFQWQTGQVLTYRVEQVMTVTEVFEGKTTDNARKINALKRWQVLAVDPAGVATLQLSMAALRSEMRTANGEVLLFDSGNPALSNPQLSEQMTKYVGTPLAVLRVDPKGRVVEVKDSKFTPASRFESELPFDLTLPDEEPKAGQAWTRDFAITLEPPEGAGEKYDAAQNCTCKTLQGTVANITVATALKAPPLALADQAPLLQSQREGEVVFDLAAGRLVRSRLSVDKELKDHLGENSSYHYRSTFMQEYVPGN